MLLGTKQQLAKVDINSITVGESVVNTKPVVRNLGSWFDSQLSMSTHINKLCSSAFLHLHNISRIRKSLSPVESKSWVILLFAFKDIHGVAPTYIQNLVSLTSQGTYNLRSSGGILLASSTFRSKVTLGDRSFQVAALKLWNALLRELGDIANLHTFKSNLKTYLFEFAYG